MSDELTPERAELLAEVLKQDPNFLARRDDEKPHYLKVGFASWEEFFSNVLHDTLGSYIFSPSVRAELADELLASIKQDPPPTAERDQLRARVEGAGCLNTPCREYWNVDRLRARVAELTEMHRSLVEQFDSGEASPWDVVEALRDAGAAPTEGGDQRD